MLISEQDIFNTADRVARQFHPERIILFGSYARGTAQESSDVDMLVVMNTDLREIEQAVQICKAIPFRFGLDLIVRTPATLQRRLALGDSFLHEVMRDGKVLYERNH